VSRRFFSRSLYPALFSSAIWGLSSNFQTWPSPQVYSSSFFPWFASSSLKKANEGLTAYPRTKFNSPSYWWVAPPFPETSLPPRVAGFFRDLSLVVTTDYAGKRTFFPGASLAKGQARSICRLFSPMTLHVRFAVSVLKRLIASSEGSPFSFCCPNSPSRAREVFYSQITPLSPSGMTLPPKVLSPLVSPTQIECDACRPAADSVRSAFGRVSFPLLVSFFRGLFQRHGHLGCRVSPLFFF